MGIKIKRDAKGGYRNWWYAEYREGKKLRTIRLDVRIAGTPPASLSIKEEGNLAFERSKALAQKSFDDFMERRQRKGVSEDILETLIESKLGEKPKYVRLDELAEMWNGIARVKPLCDDRKRNNATVFKEFAKSCKREFLFQVRDDDVKTYYDEICKLFTWATVKSRMSLLSGAFTRFLPHGCRNPFKTIIRRKNGSEGGNVHRVPLTNEQVQKLREYARADSLLYPLIECGIATGARLKDICFMRKDNIDLEEGFVSYIASKTGTLCELPLFPEFRAVVEDIITKSTPSEPLLFPEAAAMHEHNHPFLGVPFSQSFAILFKIEKHEICFSNENGCKISRISSASHAAITAACSPVGTMGLISSCIFNRKPKPHFHSSSYNDFTNSTIVRAASSPLISNQANAGLARRRTNVRLENTRSSL